MRAHRKQIVGVFVVLLTICIYILAVHQMQRLEEEMRYVSFVGDGEGQIMASENQEENQLLWSEYLHQQVENESLFRNTDTSVFVLHGRSDLLFRGAPVLRIQSGADCLVSTALAYELFGGTNVTGLFVTYQGKEYKIAGVIEQEEKIFAYESGKEEMAAFQRLVVEHEETESVHLLEETLQMKYGSGNVLDYTLLKAMLELYLLVVPCLCGIALLSIIWRYQKESQNRKEKYIWIILFGSAGMMFLFLILKNIHLPFDMIPNQWSDFEFWSDYAKYQQENFLRLVRMAKTELDMRSVRAVKNMISYNTMAIFLTVFVGRKMISEKR